MSGIVRAYLFVPCINHGVKKTKRVLLASKYVSDDETAWECASEWEKAFKEFRYCPDGIEFEFVPDSVPLLVK